MTARKPTNKPTRKAAPAPKPEPSKTPPVPGPWPRDLREEWYSGPGGGFENQGVWFTNGR